MNHHQFYRQVVDEPEDIADEPQEVVDGSDDDEIRQGAKDIPGKIGKKKMEKLEAKAEKKRMREYELQVSFFVKTTEKCFWRAQNFRQSDFSTFKSKSISRIFYQMMHKITLCLNHFH